MTGQLLCGSHCEHSVRRSWSGRAGWRASSRLCAADAGLLACAGGSCVVVELVLFCWQQERALA